MQHHALCLAGDSALATELAQLVRARSRNLRAGLLMVAIGVRLMSGGLLAANTDSCMRQENCTAAAFLVSGGAVGLFGSFVPLVRYRRANLRYEATPPGSYAAEVFRRYNEALTQGLGARP